VAGGINRTLRTQDISDSRHFGPTNVGPKCPVSCQVEDRRVECSAYFGFFDSRNGMFCWILRQNVGEGALAQNGCFWKVGAWPPCTRPLSIVLIRPTVRPTLHLNNEFHRNNFTHDQHYRESDIFLTHIMSVTHAQETCKRNLCQKLASNRMLRKFIVRETFKHNRPIKPNNFGHVHRCKVSSKSFLYAYKFLERVSLL